MVGPESFIFFLSKYFLNDLLIGLIGVSDNAQQNSLADEIKHLEDSNKLSSSAQSNDNLINFLLYFTTLFLITSLNMSNI